nr:cell division protein [Haematococcus lacustris]AUW36512.1 cell division protein [Haematococcus lacustris]
MFDCDKTEIYSHFIFEIFGKAYSILEQNREILDYYAFHNLKKCDVFELETLKLFKRFSWYTF